MDISNGEGIGISLFTQGCHLHCKNCFNTEAWDFDGGKEWSEEVKNDFIRLAANPHIKRISILGGEPLANENLDEVHDLVNEIRLSFGEKKTIWLYSGYKLEETQIMLKGISLDCLETNRQNCLRQQIISKCDVMIDGRYIDEQRDITLKWRGSKNQRCIDVQKTLKHKEVILHCD